MNNQATRYYWFLFSGFAQLISALVLLVIALVGYPLLMLSQMSGWVTLESVAAYPKGTITLIYGLGILFPFLLVAALGMFKSAVSEFSLYFKLTPAPAEIEATAGGVGTGAGAAGTGTGAGGGTAGGTTGATTGGGAGTTGGGTP